MYPGVLETALEHGYDWTLATWSKDTSPKALTHALGQLMSATLLAELSLPACANDRLSRTHLSMTLLQYAEIDGELSKPLSLLGFRRSLEDMDHFQARHLAFSPLALAQARFLPEAPLAVWQVPVSSPEQSHGQKLTSLQTMMSERLGDQVWGERPGVPSKTLAALIQGTLGAHISPDLEGLSTLEMLLVQRDGVGIRWMAPLLFQALCDLVGVVLQAKFGLQVEWGLCEVDAHGLAAPALLRVTLPEAGARPTLLPIGQALMHRTLMPRDTPYEPGIAAWLSSWVKQLRGQ